MLQIYKKKGIRKNTNTIDLYFIHIMFLMNLIMR